MRTQILLAALAIQLASAQSTTRVFHLANASTPVSLQEIATLTRTVLDIQQVTIDNASANITIGGTFAQLELAGWTIPKLDIPPGAPSPAPETSGSAGNVMLVAHLNNIEAPSGIQEILTTLRTVADIQYIYMITAQKTLAVRGTTDQIAYAQWLIHEMDRPAGTQQGGEHEFRAPSNANDVTIVSPLVHTPTILALQEILTTLRTVADVMKIYQESAPMMLAYRAPGEQLALAKWLIQELDQPAAATPSAQQYPLVLSNGDGARVFRLAPGRTPQEIQQLLTTIRTQAHIQKAYALTTTAALALRGTPDQLAAAQRLID
jgi:hypothetical protein